MSRLQFNPSTLRRLRNPATGRLMRTIDIENCWLCPTASYINATMSPSGVSLPGGGGCCIVDGYGGRFIFQWNENINGNVYTVVRNFDHPMYGRGTCNWGSTLSGAIHVKHYSDAGCTLLDYERDVDIVFLAGPTYRSGPPPFVGVGGTIIVWDPILVSWYGFLWGNVNETTERDSECLNAIDVPYEPGLGSGTVTFADV